MVVPKKIIKIEEREKMQKVISLLVDEGYSIDEIASNTGFHRVIISGVLNKGKDFSISLEKLKVLKLIIESKFNN